MGHEGCPFVARGETEEEVMLELKKHGMEVHEMTEEDITDDVKQKMKDNMKEE